MALQLYNTLTRQLQPFHSLQPGRVTIYACGVTVYDYCHLGHARSYLAWDILRRYLEFLGYGVTYVQNFTDIDDKIIKRAQQEQTTVTEIVQRYIQAYHTDMARLNIRPADHYPQATAVMPKIIELIQELVAQGYAYPVQGDVYYAVEKFPSYGQLSGRHLEQMSAGASGRVDEMEQKKHHPLDFALWKAAKPEEMTVYDPWDSPWGLGRPGWHIECSAMVHQAFGGTIDIHAGGMDLIFPHHENEIAQSEAATQARLANYWLHNGFVTINTEKMSKSLGNFTTIRSLLDSGIDPMAVRLLMLQAQYRKPLDFTPLALKAATHGWQTLKEGLEFGWIHADLLADLDPLPIDPQHQAAFQASMDDDLNTPAALAILFDLAKNLQGQHNQIRHTGSSDQPLTHLWQQWHSLVKLAAILGLEVTPNSAEPEPEPIITDAEIETLIHQRQQAKQGRNFAESDRIRDYLATLGIKLIDQKGGETRWLRS
ncbi:cysteine--tRNA ligase [Thermosynechococcaceae cyanobacterium BACA0444]|uniref:Cysteine--tRNA ligase n=1 Tax=Pseudocalidococcus azoricus BACA0444 TaxID=2918990 RepID=A0AAE4FSV2_9CYAN|nr:cysteine--tRNA ligase [Pseudocalidococcus azoricus]MDS3860702.1 cysteine--tRNA ligase [Pseudocalidococcus azoricus BACA0444]